MSMQAEAYISFRTVFFKGEGSAAETDAGQKVYGTGSTFLLS